MYTTEHAIAFMRGEISDHVGNYIDSYFKMTEEEMESCHGWVQWAFPIDTVSKFNSKAPLLDVNGDEIFWYQASETIIKNHERIIEQYMNSIGICINDDCNDIDLVKFFKVVDFPDNHHILRISRLIKHLNLTGYSLLAESLVNELLEIVINYPERFNSDTVAYWSKYMLSAYKK